MYSHCPRATKTVPAAAGSVFRCIIYLNTCLTILDRAQSWKGGATGTPKDFFPIWLHFWSGFFLWPWRAFLCPKSDSDGTPHQVDKSLRRNTSDALFSNRGSQETQEHRANAMLCRSDLEHSVLAATNTSVTLSCPSHGGTLLTSTMPFSFYQKGNWDTEIQQELLQSGHPLSHLSAFIYLVRLKCKAHSSTFCWLLSYPFFNSEPQLPSLPPIPLNSTALHLQNPVSSVS